MSSVQAKIPVNGLSRLPQLSHRFLHVHKVISGFVYFPPIFRSTPVLIKTNPVPNAEPHFPPAAVFQLPRKNRATSKKIKNPFFSNNFHKIFDLSPKYSICSLSSQNKWVSQIRNSNSHRLVCLTLTSKLLSPRKKTVSPLARCSANYPQIFHRKCFLKEQLPVLKRQLDFISENTLLDSNETMISLQEMRIFCKGSPEILTKRYSLRSVF